jgi:hypothetical protein
MIGEQLNGLVGLVFPPTLAEAVGIHQLAGERRELDTGEEFRALQFSKSVV